MQIEIHEKCMKKEPLYRIFTLSLSLEYVLHSLVYLSCNSLLSNIHPHHKVNSHITNSTIFGLLLYHTSHFAITQIVHLSCKRWIRVSFVSFRVQSALVAVVANSFCGGKISHTLTILDHSITLASTRYSSASCTPYATIPAAKNSNIS